MGVEIASVKCNEIISLQLNNSSEKCKLYRYALCGMLIFLSKAVNNRSIKFKKNVIIIQQCKL